MKPNLSDGQVHTRFHYDDTTGAQTIERIQNIEPILNSNKREQTFSDNGYSKSRDLKKIASIPMVVIEKWMKDDGVNVLALTGPERTKYFRKKLNDSDNRYLRTDNGSGAVL